MREVESLAGVFDAPVEQPVEQVSFEASESAKGKLNEINRKRKN